MQQANSVNSATAEFINDLFGVSGKSVLITGGTRGIGLEIAKGFIRGGARVYICSRDAEACAAAASELRQWGPCNAIPCNIASGDDRQQLLKQLKDHESSLDVLINNAGALWAAPLAEYPESGWDKVYNLNVKGIFFLIQTLLPMLEAAATAQDPARIINVGSANVLRIPKHETYAYVSSKAALHQLTRHLAGQLAERFITANVIAPGLFPSKMLASDMARKGEDQLAAPVPLKRLAGALDMAGAAIYLASKAGSFLTGVVLPVDGGMATTV
jgi:NAD(P)-dependent dehydrogenase (short-subunit alcohol dehydrogenase family)